MSGDELIEHRVSQLEKGMENMANVVSDLHDFAISIKAWVKVLAIVWTALQSLVIVLIIYALTGHVASP